MDDKNLKRLKETYESVEMSGKQVEQMKKTIEQAKKEKDSRKLKLHPWRIAAAAAVAAFILLPNVSKDAAYAMSSIPVLGKLVEVVTFRDYHYEDDRNSADISVPELVTDDVKNSSSESLKKSTDEINAEIKSITDKFVAEFEENLKNEWGYQDVIVQHEVISSTENYFTLKLICYQGAGSGTEWHYFYTIDLTTGERLSLKDLFTEDADYINAISENIKEQMQKQMAEDENVTYWLDSEFPEWNFKTITDETAFYLNADGNIVISFNEGDVAPMYMGCVEFEIPREALVGILKD